MNMSSIHLSRRFVSLGRWGYGCFFLVFVIVFLYINQFLFHVTILYGNVRAPKRPEGDARSVFLEPDHILFSGSSDPTLSIPHAFSVWCENRGLEYKDYLSILSVARLANAQSLTLYYKLLPQIDKHAYNTWLEQLEMNMPFLKIERLSYSNKACGSDDIPQLDFVIRTLTSTDLPTLYFSTSYIVSNFSRLIPRGSNVVSHALSDTSIYGFIYKHQNKLSTTELQTFLSQERSQRLSCLKPLQLISLSSACVDVRGLLLYPKDIISVNTTFGKLARKLTYGDKHNSLVAQKNTTSIVPNIAHCVWFGGGAMNYIFYLSVLSLLYVVEVDAVYIHGDLPPSGVYWAKLRDHPRVHHAKHSLVSSIFTQKTKSYSHMSDMIRAEAMIKYGGIYFDTDAIFVKPLDDDIRSYEAVTSFDWP